MSLTRSRLLSGAAASAAVTALPAAAAIGAEEASIEWSVAPVVDRQTFFDGKLDWTSSARRREWVGIDESKV